jgi:hypothetical protein
MGPLGGAWSASLVVQLECAGRHPVPGRANFFSALRRRHCASFRNPLPGIPLLHRSTHQEAPTMSLMSQISLIENAGRIAMADHRAGDPLPPGPNYGPFGFFRLALLALFGLVLLLLLGQFFG